MTLLPTFTSIIKSSIQFNIADLHSKTLPNNRFASAIGSIQAHSTATFAAPSTATAPATVANSNSEFVVDIGSYPSVCYSSISDFLPVAHAAYGLNQSPLDSLLDSSLSLTPFKDTTISSDPYTLITGDETASVEQKFLQQLIPRFRTPFQSDLVTLSFQEVGTAILRRT